MRFQASELSNYGQVLPRMPSTFRDAPPLRAEVVPQKIVWSVGSDNRLVHSVDAAEYTYSMDTDGNIQLVKTPKGAAGKVVTPRSGASYQAIVDQYDKLIRQYDPASADEAQRRAGAAKTKATTVPASREAAPSDLPPSAGGGGGGGPIQWIKDHPLATAGIGAGVIVLLVGAGIWYTDSQAAAEARAAGRVRA